MAEPGVLPGLVEARGIRVTGCPGWLALDAHERALGAASPVPRERVKVVPRDEQLAHSRPALVVS